MVEDKLPKSRRTCMTSATVWEEIKGEKKKQAKEEKLQINVRVGKGARDSH